MYNPHQDYTEYIKILQLLIKRKMPNFELSTNQWCENFCCLLCGKDFKPITPSTREIAAHHVVEHLKERNLLPFV